MLDDKTPRRTVYARMTSVARPGSGQGVPQALGREMFRYRNNDMLGHNGVINLVGAAINEPTLN